MAQITPYLLQHFSELNSLVISAYLFKYRFAVAFLRSSQVSSVCTGALELTLHDVILSCLTCPEPSDNS